MKLRKMWFTVVVWMVGLEIVLGKARDSRSVDQCCDRIFLSAREAIARNQEGLLGVYNWTGTHENNAYYTKELFGTTLYFYFKRQGTSNDGWTVSSDLDGHSLYLSTRSTSFSPLCPVGLLGAYDRDDELDSSFSVSCHADVVAEQCCVAILVDARDEGGAVRANQSAFVGKYEVVGELDGYPVYFKRQWDIDSYVFYSKQGDLRKDGWILNGELGSSYISMTTRSQTPCPDGISTAYDRNTYEDSSFSIRCDNDVFEQTSSSAIDEADEAVVLGLEEEEESAMPTEEEEEVVALPDREQQLLSSTSKSSLVVRSCVVKVVCAFCFYFKYFIGM